MSGDIKDGIQKGDDFMDEMSYKGFKWPNNPRICEIEYIKDWRKITLPALGDYIRQSSGPKRYIKCAGEFFSENALNHYNALKNIYLSKEAGILYHRDFGNINCVFVKLKMRLSPEKNVLKYECEFAETDILGGFVELAENLNVYDGKNYAYESDGRGRYILTDRDITLSYFCMKYSCKEEEIIRKNNLCLNTAVIPAKTKIYI